MTKFPPTALALLLVLGACNDSATAVICSDDPIPAVVLEVRDGATGASVAAEAQGTWAAGDAGGALQPLGADPVRLVAYGPAGAYALRVTHPGYADWHRTDVQVPEGRCGPIAVPMTATLSAR